MGGTGVIDNFLGVFTSYLDSGFGLLGGEVAFIATTLIVIDVTLAALFWSWGADDDIMARLVKKTLFVGVFASFVAGVGVAMAFGYTDVVSLTTIGTGAVTYIVGPVTGAAIGASSDVMALSIAAGLIKAILVMVATPFIAPYIGLNNPRSAVIFGGLMGTSSGVAGGLAATDPKLVPYGCLTAAFYTALGCLLGPSLLYFLMRGLLG